MKPWDYVNKYGFDRPHMKVLFDELAEDLNSDFMQLLEVGKARENIAGYENAIRAMYSKYEGILQKSHPSNRRAIVACWRRFYATVVAPLREELFPDEMAKRHPNEKVQKPDEKSLMGKVKSVCQRALGKRG